MFCKSTKVANETKRILKKFLNKNQYHINLEKEDSQLEEQSSKEISTLVVHVQSKVSHEQPSVYIDPIEKEIADDTLDNQVVGDSNEAVKDPHVMKVHSKEPAKEI